MLVPQKNIVKETVVVFMLSVFTFATLMLGVYWLAKALIEGADDNIVILIIGALFTIIGIYALPIYIVKLSKQMLYMKIEKAIERRGATTKNQLVEMCKTSPLKIEKGLEYLIENNYLSEYIIEGDYILSKKELENENIRRRAAINEAINQKIEREKLLLQEKNKEVSAKCKNCGAIVKFKGESTICPYCGNHVKFK